MGSRAVRAAVVVLAALAGGVFPASAGEDKKDAAAPAALTAAEEKQVDGWIRDLDHQEYARREAATEALRGFGARALPKLRDASATASEETRARARLLVLVLEAGAPAGDASRAGWYTLKGDMGRTSAVGAAPARGPSVKAARPVAGFGGDDALPLDAPLACAEGVLVAASGNRVTALRAADLSYRWSTVLGSPVLSAPVVARERVFVGTTRRLVALNLEDGHESWTVEAAYGVGASPLVSGNTLYACIGDEAVVALDPASGARRWEFRCAAGRAAPVLTEGRLVLGLRTAEVLALDAATGRPAWRLPVDGSVSFAPAAVGSSVIVGDGGRRLRCVDAETGRVLWTRSVKGRFAGDGPAVSLRAIVFAMDTLEVEAYDPATGRRLWNRWVGTFHLSSPAMAGGLVLFGSRTRLVALDAASGDDVWQVDLDGEPACPLVADGTVFALAGGRLVALR